MTIRSRQDWDGLKHAGQIVAHVLDELRVAVQPGVTTAELDRLCGEALIRHEAKPAPKWVYGFPGNLCISVNDEAVHGVPGPRVVEPGDLVKLDLVVEAEGYIADAAITVPVAPVSAADARLARVARRALGRAIHVIRPGCLVSDVGRAIEREVVRAGFSVIPELGGHGVGRAIHEEPSIPNFFDPLDRTRLDEGQVIAVEPIVSAGATRVTEDADGWTIRTCDGSRVSHHEHTLVVATGGTRVLTAI